jgi:imidazolonepropionase-like amidohydrolase
VIVFRDANVVDGQSDEARPGMDVVVDGGRIVEVAVADRPRSFPDGATVIEGAGRTVLPGLVDCHVHYALASTGGGSEAASFARAAGNARRALEAGVTTARSGGSREGLDLVLRDAIAAGDLVGPRLLASGPALTITGGYGRAYGREVDGVDAFIGAVRANVRDGVDIISVIAGASGTGDVGRYRFDEMTQAELDAVVLEATRHGRRVISYAENSEAFERSIWANVAGVEGGSLADETVQAPIAGRDMAYVPLLLAGSVREGNRGSPGEDGTADHRGEAHRRTTEAAIELGVRIAAGTGCGVPGVTSDMLAREIGLLHDHGARPIDAIRSATQWAAGLLGLDGEIGTVQAGFAADLVLVDGDPLADLHCLERPVVVVKGGRIVQGGRAR